MLGQWGWQVSEEKLPTLGVPSCDFPNQGVEKYDRARLKKSNVARAVFFVQGTDTVFLE